MKNFNRKILMLIFTCMTLMGMQADLCAMGTKRISDEQLIEQPKTKKAKGGQYACPLALDGATSPINDERPQQEQQLMIPREILENAAAHIALARNNNLALLAQNTILLRLYGAPEESLPMPTLAAPEPLDPSSWPLLAQSIAPFIWGNQALMAATNQALYDEQQEKPQTPIEQLEKVSRHDKIKCPKCNQHFATQQECDEHLETNDHKTCYGCDKTFSTRSNLNVHLKRCKKIQGNHGTIKCPRDRCKQRFATQQECNAHLQTHVTVICHKCNKPFARKFTLKRHLKGCKGTHAANEAALQSDDDFDTNSFLV